MIVIQLNGGLGNQMFQYAAAKSLALECNQKLYINKTSFLAYKLHKYGLHHFNFTPFYYKKPYKIIQKLKNIFYKKINYKEELFSYNPLFFNLKGNPVQLEGYFQSELYFKKYEKEIRNDFEITSPLKKETRAVIKHMQEVDSVSIHIRRGDYLLHEIHNTNKSEYYDEAMKLIESKINKPVYFIFSDDMPWVKQNFKTKFETIYVDFNDASTNYEDLKLMTSCKHNIIANSSFSWWGAWLNKNPNKMVIAPTKWFNDETRDYKDVIPKNWIKI